MILSDLLRCLVDSYVPITVISHYTHTEYNFQRATAVPFGMAQRSIVRVNVEDNKLSVMIEE